jgi:hypothetical protein
MPGAELKLEHILRDVLPKFEELQKLFEEAAVFIGGEALNLNPEKTMQLLAALDSIKPTEVYPRMSRAVLAGLFSALDQNAEAAESTIRLFDKKMKRVATLRTDVGERLRNPETLTSVDGETGKTLKKSLSELGLIGQTCESIEALSTELLRAAADVRHALATLEECGRIVGIDFDGSEARTKWAAAGFKDTELGV